MTKHETPKPNAADVLDEILHQAAVAEAEDVNPTAAERRWSKELGIKLDARVAELRRNLTPADAPTERAKPLRPSTLAMTRDVLLAAIEKLRSGMGGAVKYAHTEISKRTQRRRPASPLRHDRSDPHAIRRPP